MSDASAIDNKKKTQIANKIANSKTDSYNFLLSLLRRLITVGILIIIGSLGIYSCRVAQSNILPTCMLFAPYTNIQPPIKELPIDINIVKTDKGNFSTKIQFPLEENFKIINSTLGMFKNWITQSNSSAFKLYIATTLQQLIVCNLSIVNTVNNFMNSMLSETWLILLYPYIVFFTGFLTSLVNTVYFVILWFYNIYLLFSKKEESNNETTWKDGEMFGVFNLGWAMLYIFIFCILFFTIGLSFVIPIVSMLISVFCAIFPLFMKSKNVQTGKSYGVFETIKNVLKFKLNIIMIVMSLYVISLASSNFGGYAAFVAVIACVILYFFSSVYHQYTPKVSDHLTFGLGDFVQVEKPCIPTAVPQSESSMFAKIGKIFG
jgi:hypothetical protein